MGLLALLDEESKFPRATDLSLAGMCHAIVEKFSSFGIIFAVKFHGNFQASQYYNKPKDSGPTFTILHYAGPVGFCYSLSLSLSLHFSFPLPPSLSLSYTQHSLTHSLTLYPPSLSQSCPANPHLLSPRVTR